MVNETSMAIPGADSVRDRTTAFCNKSHLDEVEVSTHEREWCPQSAVHEHIVTLDEQMQCRPGQQASEHRMSKLIRQLGRLWSISIGTLKSYAQLKAYLELKFGQSQNKKLNSRVANLYQASRALEKFISLFKSVTSLHRFTSVHKKIANRFKHYYSPTMQKRNVSLVSMVCAVGKIPLYSVDLKCIGLDGKTPTQQPTASSNVNVNKLTISIP